MARWVTGAALTVAVAVATALTGCSDNNSPSATVSKAASALASATAEAGHKLDQIKNGVDAKGDVSLGTPGKDTQGHATVGLTARNTTGSAKSFAVEVDFKGSDGSLLDVVVVTVDKVAAGKSADATARSTRKLSGEVKAEVGRALRY